MATTDVGIVNSALVSIGEDTISSLTQNNRAARAANRIYEQQRDRLLMRYRWTFAMKRATLAKDATAPEFGFSARFLVPNDYLALVGVYDSAEDQRQYTARRESHKVEGQYILADAETLSIFYIRKVTNAAEFDPSFAEALAFQLAIKLAPTLTNAAATEGLKELFSEALRQARFSNAIQSSPEVIQASEWLEARQQWAVTGPFRAGPILG